MLKVCGPKVEMYEESNYTWQKKEICGPILTLTWLFSCRFALGPNLITCFFKVTSPTRATSPHASDLAPRELPLANLSYGFNA